MCTRDKGEGGGGNGHAGRSWHARVIMPDVHLAPCSAREALGGKGREEGGLRWTADRMTHGLGWLAHGWEPRGRGHSSSPLPPHPATRPVARQHSPILQVVWHQLQVPSCVRPLASRWPRTRSQTRRLATRSQPGSGPGWEGPSRGFQETDLFPQASRRWPTGQAGWADRWGRGGP